MQSYRHPNAHWFGTPNMTPGRDGHDMAIQPAYVVIHTMVGTVISANARFQQASEQASATYGIGLDGTLYQWVDEADAAWANGTFSDNPGANLDSVSIEHEDNGDYNGPRTPQLYATSAALVRDICQRYNIPIDRQHILGHRECIHASTACPDALDVDRIVQMAATGATQGGDDLTPEQDQMLHQIWNMLFWFGDSTLPSPPKISQVETILNEVKAIKAPTVDAKALAAALVADPTFLDSVASHTVKLLGSKASA